MNVDNWKNMGVKRFFDADEHLIWILGENLDDIETPEGYYEKKTDKTKIGKKQYYRKFFCNSVPVEAELYKNIKNKEICYYFPGRVIIVKKLTR